jgi:5'/3'-nucleotidase SurE
VSGPRLLLVNDDGVGAIGLQKLQAAAGSVSDDVWTVAPASERSGNSHAISLTQPLPGSSASGSSRWTAPPSTAWRWP